MKVLIVCSINNKRISPFILDQVDEVKKNGVIVDFFTVKGKGIMGYLRNLTGLKSKLNDFQPDLIHAHYGLSGLLSNLQRKVPVVTTYHGSDINDAKVFVFSKICILLSRFNILISEEHLLKTGKLSNAIVLPCGVDLGLFKPMPKDLSRLKLRLNPEKKYVLFAGSFANPVKNASLALDSVARLKHVDLIELNGYSREEVACLMNAVDACLMTSHSEGSPQFVKEAMACNCPVISVNVGDVRQVLGETDNCYVTEANEQIIAEKLKVVLDNPVRTNGRDRIMFLQLENSIIAKKLLEIYQRIAKRKGIKE